MKILRFNANQIRIFSQVLAALGLFLEVQCQRNRVLTSDYSRPQTF